MPVTERERERAAHHERRIRREQRQEALALYLERHYSLSPQEAYELATDLDRIVARCAEPGR